MITGRPQTELEKIEGQIREALEDAGRMLKEDLWQDEDPRVIAQRARDLAGLYVKARATSDPKKHAQYQLAAVLVLQHVQLLAFTRMHVAEKHALEALERFFRDYLVKILAALIPALIGGL